MKETNESGVKGERPRDPNDITGSKLQRQNIINSKMNVDIKYSLIAVRLELGKQGVFNIMQLYRVLIEDSRVIFNDNNKRHLMVLFCSL